MKLSKKDKAQFNIWLYNLYEQKFPKGKKRLQSDKGFCCLGVACMVTIPRNDRNLDLENRLIGGMPDVQKNAPKWLKNIDENFFSETGMSLVGLNDKGFANKKIRLSSFSHPEIAMLLDLWVNHKVKFR